MARGQRCPACGRLTFQTSDQIRKCSDKKCGAVGWLGHGPESSSARGKMCKVCDNGTMRRVGSVGEVDIHACSTCAAIYMVE